MKRRDLFKSLVVLPFLKTPIDSTKNITEDSVENLTKYTIFRPSWFGCDNPERPCINNSRLLLAFDDVNLNSGDILYIINIPQYKFYIDQTQYPFVSMRLITNDNKKFVPKSIIENYPFFIKSGL